MNDKRDAGSHPRKAAANDPWTATFGLDDPSVIEQLERYHERLQRDERPDRESLLRKYPHLTEELSACLDALDCIRELGPPLEEPGRQTDGEPIESQARQWPIQLGDFRLVREAGRRQSSSSFRWGVCRWPTSISTATRFATTAIIPSIRPAPRTTTSPTACSGKPECFTFSGNARG